MCDFRKINKIRFLGSGKELNVVGKTFNVLSSDMDKVTEPGFYHVAASGSFHAYFTGKEWLHEHYPGWRDGAYEVIDYDDIDHMGNVIKRVGDWDE